jgi:hypothetical protein
VPAHVSEDEFVQLTRPAENMGGMARVPPELEWAGIHVTGAELNDLGRPVEESEIVDALKQISVYDSCR